MERRGYLFSILSNSSAKLRYSRKRHLANVLPHPTEMRLYSSGSHQKVDKCEKTRLRREISYTVLPHKQLVALRGPDSASMLNGMSTNTVSITSSSGWYSAFLNAQGRILFEGFVYPLRGNSRLRNEIFGFASMPSKLRNEDWACVIEVDKSSALDLVNHLKRYKLNSKFDIGIVDPSAVTVVVAWEWESDGRRKNLQGLPVGNEEDVVGKSEADETLSMPDPRLEHFAHRFLMFGSPNTGAVINRLGTITGLGQEGPWHNVTPEVFATYRHSLGIPEGPAEMPKGTSFPHECNLDHLGAINFRKGCYVGQEHTIRTHHTGVVRKRLLPCLLYESSKPPPASLPSLAEFFKPRATTTEPYDAQDATLMVKDLALPVHYSYKIRALQPRGRVAGKWVAGPTTGTIPLGLAQCRVEMMTDVRLTQISSAGPHAEWNESVQFGLSCVSRLRGSETPPTSESEDGLESFVPGLRVKAFVPDWLRPKLTDRNSRRIRD